LGVSNVSTAFPYSFLGITTEAILPDFASVVLQPQQSFSWPVNIHHPEDVGARSEWEPLPYTIAHSGASSLCQTDSRSGPILLIWGEGRRSPGVIRGAAPGKDFALRLESLRQSNTADVGVRLVTWLDLIGMKRDGILSEKQFSQALPAAMQDPCPLIRAHAAAFPAAWQTLLLDADPRVSSKLSRRPAAGT